MLNKFDTIYKDFQPIKQIGKSLSFNLNRVGKLSQFSKWIPIEGIEVREMISNSGEGTIYRGECENQQFQLAIKVSKQNLENQYKILLLLQNIKGIPQVYSYRKCGNRNVLIMELLEQNLLALSQRVSGICEEKILTIAISVINTLKKIHKMQKMHRNIQPSNLMIKGIANPQIYMINFYDDCQNKNDKVNNWFCPLSFHKQQEYKYIDDLEMLCYTLHFLHTGTLSWLNEENNYIIMKHKYSFISGKTAESHLPYIDLIQFVYNNQNNSNLNYDHLLFRLKEKLEQFQNIDQKQINWLLTNYKQSIMQLTAMEVKESKETKTYKKRNPDTDIQYSDEENGIEYSLRKMKYKFLNNSSI